MKKIDRYILSKYLTTFFFCLLLFTAIVVVVDISEKTDDFVKSKLPVWRIITDYYFGFVPRIDAMLFPLFVFISVIFFTSKMANRSEVIAILSSGVSFRRFLMPYIVGGLFLTGLLWLGYQYVVPRANRIWGDFEARYIDPNFGAAGGNNTYKQKMYFRIDSFSYAGIRGYDTVSRTGNGFFVQRFSNNKLVYNLRAETFNWDTASRKWRLQNVVERDIDSLTEKVRFSQIQLMNYNFTPRDLRKDEYLKDQLPTPELNELIKMERLRGSEMLSTLLVERYNRDAIPVSVMILTIIGAVLASRKIRGGSGVHLAFGVLISVSYILFSRFSIVFATKGSFTPFLASWTPNIIFGLLAFYLYRKAPK
ncbi:MAG: LptF/LptG family permease [Chitinophagaceae bacterium]|nr:LptF/LptG family permease [Chitinophagaceae bacterium]MBL0056108.1 LptF/LptG family permease [Chitinophagaceae bacterium]